jgi:DNA-binding CsgD family transcriptional regulator
MLRSIEPDAPGGQYARAVLTTGDAEPARPDDLSLGTPVATTSLVDSLSDRELDVSRLLEGDLGGPGIARALSVSVNTVRTHTRHIYAKLGVTNRREALCAKLHGWVCYATPAADCPAGRPRDLPSQPRVTATGSTEFHQPAHQM